MPSLSNFGYASKEVKGEKNLLLILATLVSSTDPFPAFAHSKEYFEDLIFSNPEQNINDYFKLNSRNNLSLTHAGTLEVMLDEASSTLDTIPRLGKVKELAIDTGFDFSRFESNSDGTISTNELYILVVDNKSFNKGATRPTIPEFPPVNSELTLSAKISLVGHQAGFATIAHEISHLFGTIDLYFGGNGNFRNTLMGATIIGATSIDNMTSFHLDPWHKMLFGWVKPDVFNLNNGNRIVTLHAPQFPEKYNTYIITKKSWTGYEFFMIEYRSNQLSDDNIYDEGTQGWGLIVWQITNDSAAPRKAFTLGASQLRKGGPNPWGYLYASQTPPINWFSGRSANLALRVLNFTTSDTSIQVEIISRKIFFIAPIYLAWAWIIVIGGLMITPGGIGCPACGPIWTNVIGVVSITVGVAGIVSNYRRRK